MATKVDRMVMKLNQVIPFGRSLDEYQKMFVLSEGDLKRKMVGVGDGPASFNAQLFALGTTVVSVDPLYVFSAEEIERQFSSVIDNVIGQVKATPGDWVWSYHRAWTAASVADSGGPARFERDP